MTITLTSALTAKRILKMFCRVSVCRVCPVRKESLKVDMDRIPLLGCMKPLILLELHKCELDYINNFYEGYNVCINETKLYHCEIALLRLVTGKLLPLKERLQAHQTHVEMALNSPRTESDLSR